jgi:hypothetical protein
VVRPEQAVEAGEKLLPSVVWLEGLSRVAHKAGVSVKASSAEKADGEGQSDRELAVDAAGGAWEERHGHEHAMSTRVMPMIGLTICPSPCRSPRAG